MTDEYKGYGMPFDMHTPSRVSLKEFLAHFSRYIEEVGVNPDTGNIASHKIVGTIGVRCINPENLKSYKLVGIAVDQLPGCGCWDGITLEIEEYDD